MIVLNKLAYSELNIIHVHIPLSCYNYGNRAIIDQGDCFTTYITNNVLRLEKSKLQAMKNKHHQ